MSQKPHILKMKNDNETMIAKMTGMMMIMTENEDITDSDSYS